MASTKPRSKSAKPGLMSTTNRELEWEMMAQSNYSQSQRAQSAHGNRRKAEGTGRVFPRQAKGGAKGSATGAGARSATGKDEEDEMMSTYYAREFEAKTVRAEERQARPTSSTRRNNPHPQLEFMQWRLPVRVLDSRQGTVQPPTQELIDTKERFYQDYSSGNDGDACNEVSTTIARSEFVGRLDPNAPVVDTTASVQFPGYPGTQCRSNTGRMAPLPAEKTTHDPKKLLARPGSAVAKTRVVKVATQSKGTAKNLDNWLESGAASEEKEVVMKMLQSGATDEIRLRKALQSTLAAEALPGVERWMEEASDNDRKLVLQVFEGLSEAGPPRAPAPPLPSAQAATMSQQLTEDDSLPPLAQQHRPYSSSRVGKSGSRARTRRASDPLPLPLATSTYENAVAPVPMLYRNTGAEKILRYNRTRPLGSRAGSRMRSASMNGRAAGGKTSSLEETLDGLALDAGVDGTEARFSPLPSMNWHSFSNRQHTPNVVHRGAVFGGPRAKGSHWSICPEWQTA